ncbi:choice-of-anchor F family protein [Marinobacter sp. BW6]|uniref:choice-of-anchor F family protein n=1 Tax=Marinobacter sp. BW6 TaxID=2592624 RepID=UPI00139678B2|nr:choice-of-anchor F family protein [Marinobacter sp. BW6]
MIGLPHVAVAATMDRVNEENLAVPPVDGKTVVYTDTEGTASFGWLDPVNDFGNVGLGIKVYNEPFTAQQTYDFAGCLMAQPDRQLVDPSFKNCTAPPDSGKRFKLKTTETNGPIDIVVDVSADDSTSLYRVLGKFSNLTDASNAVGGEMNAFRFELGFGVGTEFIPSSIGDGLSFGFANGDKLSIGPIGKYPGGLFGGSKAEGLPFFSTEVAAFTESVGTADDGDVLETNGTIPVQYSTPFGDWRTLSQTPTGWFIDHDGNPANDSILLAFNAGTAAAPDWQTNEKQFNAAVTVDHDDDASTAELSAELWDPNSVNFDATVAGDVLPLVETLGEGDPDDTVTDAISLSQLAASALYDGSFNVLIDGEAVAIDAFADWANNPVTVIDADNGNELVATWDPETELYDIASAYAETYGATLTLSEMLDISGPPDSTSGLVRQPGYTQGPIEDLANVNINPTISVGASSNWPTCTGDGVNTTCSFTVRFTGLNGAVDEPTIPGTPVEPQPEPEEPAAASNDGDGPIFGCTAGKPGSPFDPVLPGMVLMALGGLWARKRLSNA